MAALGRPSVAATALGVLSMLASPANAAVTSLYSAIHLQVLSPPLAMRRTNHKLQLHERGIFREFLRRKHVRIADHPRYTHAQDVIRDTPHHVRPPTLVAFVNGSDLA